METLGAYRTNKPPATRLLIDEYPLIILPSLAAEIGLHEAIVLQQIHYWTTGENAKIRDGYRWVYNSYANWTKQFPFLSEQQIGRVIRALEQQGLLISGNYNTLPIDRTKWYRINYDSPTLPIDTPLFTGDTTKVSPVNDEGIPSERPIPETTTETTPEITYVRTHTHSSTGEPQASHETDLFIASVFQENFGRQPKPGQLKQIKAAMETAPIDRWSDLLKEAFQAAMRYPNPTPGSVAGMINSFAKKGWNTERPQPGMVENMRVLN